MTKLEALKAYFGYSQFRSGQEDVIDTILSGTDVLAVMPTGAGKSLCYQIPALLLPGITVVISPLISLMKDQVHALTEAGCPAAFLNSSQSPSEHQRTMQQALNGGVKLLYIAPERLQTAALSAITEHATVPLLVIDEAHCVSQWGHDFRTSYRSISDFVKDIKPRPVMAAFTATATEPVRQDIIKLLALEKPFAINTGFDRPNLYFEVQRPKKKKDALLDCLSNKKETSGIVYCSTRKSVEEVCAFLIEKGYSATQYHAGLDERERHRNQDDFLYDRKTIMVATNAFGMGIDKSNVSYVIHYNMPKNIEAYYQEAGRAGRDGAPAACILLYSGQDVQIHKFLITQGENREAGDPRLEAHNLELLKQITFYATASECLRRRLLLYFGQQSPSYCGNCSNCLTEFVETDVSLEGRKIVSCVYRLKERNRSLGKSMIIDILRGAKTQKIKDGGFDTLSTWGIMKDTSAEKIRTIIDCLIDNAILLQAGSEFPVLSINNIGNAKALLRQETPLIMKAPKEERRAKKQSLSMTQGQSEEKAALNKGKTTSKATASTVDVDTKLFERLKKLRREIATRDSVPAYIVFSDASLLDMCHKKPVSLPQFANVNGVGGVKLEKYATAFCTLITDYLHEESVSGV